MDGEEANYPGQEFGGLIAKLRDIEEKQRIMKERLLLVVENMLEIKEKSNEEILEMKKDIEILKQTSERMRSFLETASGEFSKFARKEDLEILSKQAKMFRPLEKLKKR